MVVFDIDTCPLSFILHVLLRYMRIFVRCFNLLYAAVVFWPKFYWHMFGPSSEGRSILSILSHPLGDDFPSQAARERFEDDQQLSNCHVSLKPTHARLYVHTICLKCLTLSFQITLLPGNR